MKTKVAFLGAGNMGGALIQGALKSGFIRAPQITIYDVDRAKAKTLAGKWRVRAASSVEEAARGADYIFLCVKPQQMKEVLSSLKPFLSGKQCLISIAAGVTTRSIEAAFAARVPVVRVMPNTPALLGKGMSAITRGRRASPKHQRFAVEFFSSVGKTVALPEKHFDAVTAVSGSGPAYVFHLTEALEATAKSLGIPGKDAGLLARQTVMGAAAMLAGQDDPATLRQKVTSPGGTTAAAFDFLKKKHWALVFAQAVRKARDRSKELSR